MINSFRGTYQFLSNFYQCKVYYTGIAFPSVEHAYQASKTFNYDVRHRIANIKPNEAYKAKRMGKNRKIVILRQDWNEIKLSTMELLLLQKFEPIPLKRRLLKTKNQKLIEGNDWHDNFWGDCGCNRCQSTVGQNHQGKLLMKVRDSLWE